MSGYIIIDTEGSGLFQHKAADGTTMPSDAPGQPRMAEFAAVFTDNDFNILHTYQSYIQPVGWDHDMPQQAIDIHGLTMDFLREHGKPVELSLSVYSNAIEAENILLGFNQQHDGRQVRAELRRAGRDDLFERTPNICVMRSLMTAKAKAELGAIKKLNGKGGFPRLIDAAAHFGIPYPEDKRHTALEDAKVTALIAQIVNSAGCLLPAEVHYAKNHPSRIGAET